MRSIISLALACVFLIIFNSSESQAQTKLYVPSSTSGIYNTQSGHNDGIGINKSTPTGGLHIYERRDAATALKIDLDNPALPGGGFALPEFALEVSFSPYGSQTFTRYLSIDNNGRLRVGKNNDLYTNSDQLSVSKSFGLYKDADRYLRMEYNISSPKFTWKSEQALKFINENSGTEPLTFSSDGKIGINTDNFIANHKLMVNGSTYFMEDTSSTHTVWIEGSVIAEEIFVKLKADWADYVFAPDYNLMPIKELEAYVNRNQRLPGMKSAEEISEEGVAVGETERKLTEKVEELTLYIIEMNKKIEALEAKLAEAEEEKQ